MRRAQTLWLAGFFVAALFLVGCDGASLGDVTGTVKYDGKLIEDGSIRFEDINGKAKSAGGNIKGGQYAAPRVPVGNMKVTITASKVIGKKKLYENKDEYIDLKGEALPDKYSDLQKTELRFEVKPGANNKDWDLSK